MHRREFLKLIAAIGAYLAIPPGVIELLSVKEWDWTKEYGMMVYLPQTMSGWRTVKTYGPKGGVRPKMSWRKEFVTSAQAKAETHQTREYIIEFLKTRAKSVLPPNAPFDIRQTIPMDFGRTRAIAWYSSPDMYDVHRSNSITPLGGSRFNIKTKYSLSGAEVRVRPDWVPRRIDKFDAPTGVIMVERCLA